MEQRGEDSHEAIQRIRQEPTEHTSKCYFCMVELPKHRTGKNAFAVTYPDLPSSIPLENMRAYSEEQGECFHQCTSDFECPYQGQYKEDIMGDYILGLDP
ncbi:hypothetical protein J437_LFUL004790 [Ladona fulva]|uniref:Uncharacterized protein n=1 Tax=Ladona fulva TaxID=123851 RepID=A0A8K0NV92_LADFU|nr:hypothetical protein J437_LFUL004788 [Ladona fulva]KAG8225860.1 hypothetical protein J437_LFUL004790 [Ladona fulva]